MSIISSISTISFNAFHEKAKKALPTVLSVSVFAGFGYLFAATLKDDKNEPLVAEKYHHVGTLAGIALGIAVNYFNKV